MEIKMEILEKYFTGFSAEQQQQISGLKDIYSEWNEKINVISRKDMDNFYVHHVLHSLSIAAQFEFAPGARVMDLGCGGGFPGVPLAIYFPETHFHLVDSINKKLIVVQEVCKALHIRNVSTQHIRAEEIKGIQFDCVVSRAVAPLKDLWRWSRPLIKKLRKAGMPNGLVCLKGGDLTKEIQESNCRPQIWEISQFFEEAYFKEKFILYHPLR